ncbi:hypothetical protein P691DRAFT_792951 [Macrolepiota fuliginosa MF-IS2]|uniref:DUF3074 domain-containing protein n=1 Tax=Macrolepiota fuliginosa MF-IS2 TaxID=1400762 RepID=A0A9P5XBK7_9AGAR|nr:hypothetical protein P691DRAFT_792951 [Macrolepiota fuliginosa MF-IS2]
MADSKPLLTISPRKLSDIPSEESIIAAGRELIESTESWKEGKTHFTKVKTLSRPGGPPDNDNWHCRVSEHTPEEVTFDVLWDKMAKDKALNEKEFIPAIDKVTQVQELSPTAQIWTIHYKFPLMVSDRVFTVLQVVHKEDSELPSGLIVSIPIDLSGDVELQKLEEEGVRGYYVSVERVKQLENGNVEWRMATSSDTGGLIPKFIADLQMPKAISEDVPHFLHWVEKQPKST